MVLISTFEGRDCFVSVSFDSRARHQLYLPTNEIVRIREFKWM